MAARVPKISVKRLNTDLDELHGALGDAVDEVIEAERRSRALDTGDDANRDEMERTYPALKGQTTR